MLQGTVTFSKHSLERPSDAGIGLQAELNQLVSLIYLLILFTEVNNIAS